MNPAQHCRTRRESGIALVIVLGFLVLISALVISFFSSVSTELVSAKSSQAAVSSRQLSESATNLVMSQIADGTAGFKDSTNLNSGVLAWASQPGMIRTFDEDGNAYRFYKLYSARNMVLTDIPAGYNVNREFESDVPADWGAKPASFVDLNAPVKSADGNYDYPIVNPQAQKTTATSTDGIEGFEVIKPPGFEGGNTRPNDSYDPTSGPKANPAPMPVRWLYVLQNGGMIPAPEPGGDGKLSWSSSDIKPAKDNPIVGRIAFWADDDTAKININTASEGTFWDRPWSRTGYAGDESNFAQFIPGQNEFQRYPGHPAMTCLSPVFGMVMNYKTAADKSRYYFLVPRVMDGGTRAGTQVASSTNPLLSDNERLFATVDELAFAPQFTGIRTVPNGLPAPRVREFVSKAKFFLTANSRAPEVNLFNKPRVGLWPIQADPKERGAVGGPSSVVARDPKDKLIAFCGTTATTGNKKAIYYFQRLNEYVVNNAKIFGDGRTFTTALQPSSTSPVLDYTNVPRNQQLYTYLQKLTDGKVPGFGGSLRAKYDNTPTGTVNERDQILTEMMDYIRTNVNSYNTSGNMTPQYDYAPTRKGGPVAGETQLVPLVLDNNTKGLGRFATVSEAAIVFTRRTVSGQTPREELNAHLVMELFNPTPGLASWSPHVRYVVKGLERFQVGGSAFGGNRQNMNWANAVTTGGTPQYSWNFVTSRVGYSGGGHTMPFMGLWASFRYFNDGGSDNTKRPGVGGSESEYPFYTATPNVIADSKGTFDLVGGPIQIEIYSGFENCRFPSTPPSAKNLVQVINMRFPDQSGLPLPGTSGTQTFADRLNAGTGALINGGLDVVRSVELRPDSGPLGDPRMACALKVVPESFYVPHWKYSMTSERMAHSLRSEESRYSGQNGTAITLVSGVAYNREPAAARGVTQALLRTGTVTLPGDWDNATGDSEDGAYVNKADEGNLATPDGGYFSRGSFNVETGATFSPNRQIASAVAFGSLPTGVKVTEAAMRKEPAAPEQGRPWQTLLFCPNPAAKLTNQKYDGTNKHPGFGTVKTDTANPSGLRNQPPYVTPPDHLFLDLFTMPIVEPYAISEPLSTSSKINLNYQIAPFTYIKRTTGLKAALRATKVMAIPSSSADKSQSRRYEINADVGNVADGGKLDGNAKGTLFYFHDKFANGDIFRSASQICDVPLIPTGAGAAISYDSIDNFWNQNRRTGDNVREIPYGHIYPRVTTKSNTFTVHMRVQALRKAAGSDAEEWDESRDQVLSEYRGSTTVERYVDPADPTLPDFAKTEVEDNVDRHYRFRVIATKAFTP